MSERNDLSKAQFSSVNPAIVAPQPATRAATEILAANVQTLPPPQVVEEEARARIAALEREAKALGADPQAALLFHEIGLLWEAPLKNPRNAAVAFQNAYKLSPRFLSNIRAARRLFSDVGNWQMVVQLLDAELSALEDPRQKAALLLEKASVLEERLAREEDAAATYRACLELSPRDLSLLIQLEGVYAAKQDYASLVAVYRLIAESLEDVTLRAHYLTSAGQVLEERLKQPEAAAAAYREAFGLDRRDLLLLAAVKRLAEREGHTEELLEALAAEAAVLGAQAAPSYLQISKVYERLDRKEDALAALLAARRASPNEPLVLSELARIYEAQRRYEDLSDVLLSWAGSINDESELVAVNLRLAALYEEDLKRDEDAIKRYQAILARVPGHTNALAGLGKLYFRTKNWEGLAQVFESEAAVAEDNRQKAAKVYKAAEVLEERLNRADEAVLRYNQCLQIQPGYLPAQKALARLYERAGRFADLVAMYEQDLSQTQDREQSISTLNKMAVLYEERLNDLDGAVECMRRILELSPEHLGTIHNLARLYERAGKWRELLELHEQEAALAGDTKQILSLRHRNAEVLEEQLKDRAGAIAEYERVLALSPSYLPALKSLGRLYAQDGRWTDLIKMYRAESEISSSPEQAAALIHKIGELYDQKLKSENDAIASYQEVLTLAPNYFPALRALGRIYRSQGHWESLIEVLRAEAANRTDPVERSNALFQAAAIWEDHLNRPDMAIEGYQEVLRLTPSHATALRALERLYTAKDDIKELIAVLDREAQTASSAPSAQVAAYLKLSRLYLDRLNEPSRAVQCCEAVLAIEPGNLTALKTIERVRASDRTRRAEVRTRLAERITDTKLRAALRISSTDPGTSPAALEELKQAAKQDPADPRLTFALERALRQAGDFEALTQLYERQLSSTTESGERVELALRIADIAENRLGDLGRAVAFYRAALELAPNLLPALQGARRAFLKLGDYASARSVLEIEGRASKDPRGAIESLISAARLCAERLNDPDGAIADYRLALERDPLDAAASAGLEELLASRGGGADLAAMHERRGEAKLAQKDAVAAAQEFLSAAKAWLDKAQDKGKALAALDRALMAQPSLPEALELRGQLALDAHQYADAAAAFAARVQQGGDARTLSAIHLKLGMLYQDHLSDVNRAAAHLQTAVSGDPNNLEALKRLAGIHTQSRNWTGAADCLKRLVDLERQPQALAGHMVALARILDEGFADQFQAASLYRRAMEMSPGDTTILDRLVSLYERGGNLPDLVQVLEQQSQQALSAGDTGRAVALKMKVGDLYARAMGNAQRAVATYRTAVDLDKGNLAAHAALADLYMRDAAAAPLAIQEHLAVLRLDPTRVDSLHALFRLWEGLRQTDKAFCAASLLHFLRATNEVEAAFYAEARNRIPTERQEKLLPSDLDALLHPGARNAVVEVFRAIGDHLSKLYPPQFDALGVDRKQDRLKPDHAVFKAIRTVAQIFGVEEFEVYQSRRGMMVLETTEPLSVCVGQDVVRKFNAREQKFLIGRAVLGLANKTAVLAKLSTGETADLVANAVRVHDANFGLFGRRNEELVKQLRKLPRKALKALEAPSSTLAYAQKLDLQETLTSLTFSADRSGLLMCGDLSAGLTLVLREDPNIGARVESPEMIAELVRQREDLRALMAFALSDELFRLRQKLGIAV